MKYISNPIKNLLSPSKFVFESAGCQLHYGFKSTNDVGFFCYASGWIDVLQEVVFALNRTINHHPKVEVY
jgi:hypothetical protein